MANEPHSADVKSKDGKKAAIPQLNKLELKPAGGLSPSTTDGLERILDVEEIGKSRSPHNLPSSTSSLKTRQKFVDADPDGPSYKINASSIAHDMLHVEDGGIRPPELKHGLERVLFNPGVHLLRDLRTNVYNFDHRIEDLPMPADVRMDTFPTFIPPSEHLPLV